ncbi:hypothetical protein K438DRAFT_1776598 [Mycena galopus ATCC 62051]|nr:hypothetical protein K438DRAFT_1776598 [Mycena galopus ATCC 62051]
MKFSSSGTQTAQTQHSASRVVWFAVEQAAQRPEHVRFDDVGNMPHKGVVKWLEAYGGRPGLNVSWDRRCPACGVPDRPNGEDALEHVMLGEARATAKSHPSPGPAAHHSEQQLAVRSTRIDIVQTGVERKRKASVSKCTREDEEVKTHRGVSTTTADWVDPNDFAVPFNNGTWATPTLRAHLTFSTSCLQENIPGLELFRQLAVRSCGLGVSQAESGEWSGRVRRNSDYRGWREKTAKNGSEVTPKLKQNELKETRQDLQMGSSRLTPFKAKNISPTYLVTLQFLCNYFAPMRSRPENLEVGHWTIVTFTSQVVIEAWGVHDENQEAFETIAMFKSIGLNVSHLTGAGGPGTCEGNSEECFRNKAPKDGGINLGMEEVIGRVRVMRVREGEHNIGFAEATRLQARI